jgi:hypothetical protein
MPNHPPAPVQNLINVLGPMPGEDECNALKDKHKVTTRSHDQGAANLPNTQSHHILQNAAVGGTIPRSAAQAVLLPIKVHQTINRLQVARNCPGPAPTSLGKLVVNARDDLATALKKKKPDGLGIKDPEATQLASCVTKEAVDKGQALNKNKLGPNTRVKQPKGCLAAGTLVWLEGGRRLAAEHIRPGMTLSTGHVVRSVGGCGAPMVEIVTVSDVLVIAGRHRVRLAGGATRAAGRVSPGDLLLGAGRPVRVVSVRPRADVRQAFSIATDESDVLVGVGGLSIEGRETTRSPAEQAAACRRSMKESLHAAETT